MHVSVPSIVAGAIASGIRDRMCILAEMDLEALVDAYREGQTRARRQLAVELHRIILPVFRGRFDEVDVEDLVQESIDVTLRELDKFESRGPGSFRAWVRRIALNRRLAFVDRQGREHARRDDLGEHEGIPTREPGPREVLHWRERLAVVKDALDQIDPVFRSALEHLIAGGDPAELAEQVGVRPQTIRSRASRALAALRGMVRGRWESSGRFLTTPG
jgi:RNA polymerase sigma factor (sigma-70 family)